MFIQDWGKHGSRSKISSLNKKLYKVLEELQIQYVPEFSLKYKTEEGGNRWKSYDAKIGNLLIEVNGDYWHANLIKYKEDHIFIFPKSELTAKEVWNMDKYKEDIANAHGYSVMYIWESEINENIEDVKQRIKNCIN